MSERIAFLRALARNLHRACGASLVWKDADPSQWSAMPADIAQHRNPACRAVKRRSERVARCSAHCNQALADDVPRPRLRSCPFGLRELVLPVFVDGRYQGQALIGCWRDRRRKPEAAELQAVWQGMPACDEARARAIAALAAASLQAIPAADQSSLPADPRLQLALKVIATELHLSLRAGAVARELGLSSSRFVHWFKEASGQSYSEHLRAAVLKRAAGHLSHSDRQILDIALDLGFASHSAFSAAFRKHFGSTPSAFRRRCRSIA